MCICIYIIYIYIYIDAYHEPTALITLSVSCCSLNSTRNVRRERGRERERGSNSVSISRIVDDR